MQRQLSLGGRDHMRDVETEVRLDHLDGGGGSAVSRYSALWPSNKSHDGLPVMDDAGVTGSQQATDHAVAHPTQSDHAEFQSFAPLKRAGPLRA